VTSTRGGGGRGAEDGGEEEEEEDLVQAKAVIEVGDGWEGERERTE